MKNELEFSDKFLPLFELLQDKHNEVDTVIITGGRYSLKSYSVSIFAITALFYHFWNILYTRFTNSTIVDSVKPEVSDKIELLNLQGYLKDTESHIESNGNRISFKGIRPGQKSQTANLKSLSGFNCFINDEAEELPDYKTFKKIFYSIRDTTKRNLSILILNPTTKEHWIFQEFFEKKGLEGGENCIVDNVMYIHSSYLDCDRDLMPKNILNDYERMKIEKPTEYDNIVLGGWITEPEGVLLPKSKLHFANMDTIPEDAVVYRFAVGDPADMGGDKFSMPFCFVCCIGDDISVYVKEVVHSTAGIAANTERIVEKVFDNSIEHILYESNGVGVAAVLLIAKELGKNQKLTAFNATQNKDVRIFSHYEFVQKHFIFDEKYKDNPEYLLFINDLTSYSKDGDNKHKKDAIDVMCSAANIIKIKYRSVLYPK